jgi:hypothetical protein
MFAEDPTIMDDLTCSYCLRHFKYRDLYLQHELSCVYSLRRKRIRETDALEDLPSGQDQFKWIQSLALRVGVLEKEISRLRSVESMKKRNGIHAWLRHPLCQRPTITLNVWFSMYVKVDFEHLNMLDQFDLIEVMEHILSSTIHSNISNHVLPMIGFVDGIIYIWEYPSVTLNDNVLATWYPLTMARWDTCISHLQQLFRKSLNTYFEMISCGMPLEHMDVNVRECMFERMRRINTCCTIKKKQLKKWLAKQLEKQNPAAIL